MKIDQEIQSEFKNSMHRAVVNVRYTSNVLASRQHKYMSTFGLSLPQFNILRILRGAKKMISVNSIKERMVEKSPNTTRLMDKLLEKELIVRERCEGDRRIVYAEISKKGLKLLSQIDDAFSNEDENIEMVPKSLTSEEADQLSDLLDKLRS
ncbi:MAG: MarR family 2-MHQ and catechol resistance regulon transcriptional repressor [Flavobacteriaceae bacterium]|jgi:MarR family 2-MHQ and catechol resistance regulon transcriptional repressor